MVHLKIRSWKRSFLFETIIFRFHSFNFWWCKASTPKTCCFYSSWPVIHHLQNSKSTPWAPAEMNGRKVSTRCCDLRPWCPVEITPRNHTSCGKLDGVELVDKTNLPNNFTPKSRDVWKKKSHHKIEESCRLKCIDMPSQIKLFFYLSSKLR